MKVFNTKLKKQNWIKILTNPGDMQLMTLIIVSKKKNILIATVLVFNAPKNKLLFNKKKETSHFSRIFH